MRALNYLEFLQIGSRAEPESIHRVVRFPAFRFHPGHSDTGDAGKGFLLKTDL